MERALSLKSEGIGLKWITREDAKVDRIAFPWLIRRFVDKDAGFLYVPVPKGWISRRSRKASPSFTGGTTAGKSHWKSRCTTLFTHFAWRGQDTRPLDG